MDALERGFSKAQLLFSEKQYRLLVQGKEMVSPSRNGKLNNPSFVMPPKSKGTKKCGFPAAMVYSATQNGNLLGLWTQMNNSSPNPLLED